MAALPFTKYQGTGNDFIMVDNRNRTIDPEDLELVRKLCHRKFGIGADGFILIENHVNHDFEMIYYNPDGSKSLCGNGSRCAVMFAHSLGLIGEQTIFQTIEGPLYAFIDHHVVHLKMPDVDEVRTTEKQDFFVDTGSPHYVCFVKDIDSLDVYRTGKEIRDSVEFQPHGTNVNFVQWEDPGNITVRTFERGVEDETLSCGTGVTASALVTGKELDQGKINIRTKGGELSVSFEKNREGKFSNIYLIGPAKEVFTGIIEI